MELLVGAAVVLVGAIIGAVVAYRIGLHPVQQALVNSLKERVSVLEAQNKDLKAQVAKLEAVIEHQDREIAGLREEMLRLTAKVVVATT